MSEQVPTSCVVIAAHAGCEIDPTLVSELVFKAPEFTIVLTAPYGWGVLSREGITDLPLGQSIDKSVKQ
jgi:hypothetical protein